jgi:hypothetical protein
MTFVRVGAVLSGFAGQYVIFAQDFCTLTATKG